MSLEIDTKSLFLRHYNAIIYKEGTWCVYLMCMSTIGYGENYFV